MSSARSRGPWLLALALALVVSVVGLVPTAFAATSRTLSAAASPAAPVRGTSFTVAGTLSASPVGATVLIQRFSAGAWRPAATAHTSTAGGHYAVRLTAPGTPAYYSYRAFAPTRGALRAAVSRTFTVVATRPVRATISRSATTIRPGSSVTLSGTVSPFVRGSSVTIQRRVGTTWRALTTATLNSRGGYSRAIKPTATTAYRVSVPRRALNAAATSGATTVTVLVPPTITSAATLPTAAQAFHYSVQLTKTGGAGTWSIVKGFLPFSGAQDPMQLNANTGVISGTPTAIETEVFTVRFHETATGLTSDKQFTINVIAAVPPTINTTSLPNATKRTPYSAHLSATGTGGASGTWTIVTGTLPGGLSLSSGGVISGTPLLMGTATFTVQYTENGSHLTATQQLSLTVVGVPPTINTTALGDATRTQPYSAQLAVTGGPGTWAVVSGSLPPGLSLSAGGMISGTPTAENTYSFTVAYTESDADAQSAQQALSIIVHSPSAPVITTTSLPAGVDGTAYAAQLQVTTTNPVNATGTWSLASGTLPSGLTLNTSTGAITGTPTEYGDFDITVSFLQDPPVSESATSGTLRIHVVPGNPVVTTTSLPDANQGVGYNVTLTKTGGTGAAGVWTIPSGALPTGLVLDGPSGLISGTPTVSGSHQITVVFTENGTGLASAPQQLTLNVVAATPPTITTTSLPDAGQYANYSTTLTKTAGVPGGNGVWSITAGALPTGITLTGSTGVIAGKTTQIGDYVVTFTYTENASTLSDSKQLTLHVTAATAPTVTTTTVPNAQQDAAYTTTLAKTAGTPAGQTGVWSVSAGSLPAGLSLNASTGVISGTPTGSGDSTFTVSYTENVSGLAGTQQLTLHVNPATPPMVTTTSLPDVVKGKAYSVTLTKTAGTPGGPGSWSIASGTLPTGITLSASTGVLSGTPTVAGDSFFTVRYTESASGLSGSASLSIHVPAASTPAITTSSLLVGQVGVAYSFQLQGSLGTGPVWSIRSGALPAGLSMSSSGKITGTPAAGSAGTYTIVFRLVTVLPLNGSDNRTLTLTIAP
jgi:hypothetical protein